LNIPYVISQTGYSIGANEVISAARAAAFITLNTGHGANELYAMNQDVESTDAVTFATVDTGQGANELYGMDQGVESTDNVVFSSVDVDEYYLGTVNVTGILAYPQQPASYIVWEDGATYYAKSGADGAVVSSANASLIIQNALDAGAGRILLKNGNYYISVTIRMGIGDILQGESKRQTILESQITDGSHVISANAGKDDITAFSSAEVHDLMIRGNGAEGDGIYFEYVPSGGLITTVYIINVGGSGIRYHHCYGSKIINAQVVNCTDAGIKLEDRCHGVEIITPWIGDHNNYGVYGNNPGGSIKIIGGVIQQSYINDIFIYRCPGLVIQDVYLENSHADVYMINLTGELYYWAKLSGLYLNGASKAANGIYLERAGTIIESVHFEGVDVPVNITVHSKYTRVDYPRLSACNAIIDNGVSTTIILSGTYTTPNIDITGEYYRNGANYTQWILDTIGFTTKSIGVVTINNGSTSIVITHGLGYTPSSANTEWTVTYLENPTNDCGSWYIDTFTSTQATIHVFRDPGASNLDLTWTARRMA